MESKTFEINAINAYQLGNLLIHYGESWNKFFKVWEEIRRKYPDLDLAVIDYSLTMVKISSSGCFKWVNINNSEKYITDNLLYLIDEDLVEHPDTSDVVLGSQFPQCF